MNDFLMPLTIIGSFGASLYFFTKVLTDYILKKKMIEKGYVTDDTQAVFKQHAADGRYGSLKWGLLCLSGGIALILMHTLDVDPESTLPFGIFTVALSVGFLAYYAMVRKEFQK